MSTDKKEEPNENGSNPVRDGNSSPKGSDVQLRINQIYITFLKDTFYEGETIKGSVFVNLTNEFHPKKLMLSVIGELYSQQAPNLKKQKSIKKNQTSPFAFDTHTLARSLTHRNKQNNNIAQNSPTLLRTLTISSKKKVSRFGTGGVGGTKNEGNSQGDGQAIGNREIFVHYNVPIFTFKTHKLHPGKYQFPFQFQPSPQMMASFNYDDKGFRLQISYSITAELEKDEDDSQEQEDEVIDPNLRTRKELKIAKQSPKANLEGVAGSYAGVSTEATAKLKMPSFLCCCSVAKTEITMRLDRNTFKLGEKIKFEIESLSFKLELAKCIVKANLIEEIIQFPNEKSTKSHELKEIDKLTLDEKTSRGNAVFLNGSVLLPESMFFTCQTPHLDIEHLFELEFIYKGGVGKGKSVLRVRVVIKQAGQALDPIESLGSVPEEDDEDDIAMVLPLSKFKLEEKFNLLTRTANALNEMEEDKENQTEEENKNRFFNL